MRPETKERYKQVIALYKSGKSLEDIATATGYKVSSVKTIINSLGVSIAPPEIDNNLIIQMRKDGKTLKEIGNVVGLSAASVSLRLDKAGYKKAKHRADMDVPVHSYAVQRRAKMCVVGGKRYADLSPLIG